MRYKKGQSGNPAGRPKGIKDKRTQQWEELMEYMVSEGSERAMQHLESLDGEQFFEAFMKILEYAKPKKARTEIDATVSERSSIRLNWGNSTHAIEAEDTTPRLTDGNSDA